MTNFFDPFILSPTLATHAKVASLEKRQCITAIMPEYTDRAASVEQKQVYADCINLVHPTYSYTLVLVMALLAIMGGICHVITQDDDDLFQIFRNFFAGFLVSGCVLVFSAFIVHAVYALLAQ